MTIRPRSYNHLETPREAPRPPVPVIIRAEAAARGHPATGAVVEKGGLRFWVLNNGQALAWNRERRRYEVLQHS